MRLECTDLSIRYPNAERDALEGASVSVESGEMVTVVGPSGSGKSTLLLALAALLKPDAGSVTADGLDVWAGDVVAVRRRAGIVFQNPESQFFAMTVKEEVAFGPSQMRLAEPEVRRRVDAALEVVGLGTGFADRNPFMLSGGEQRRLALATALAMEPELLLLDEPTAGLDAAGKQDFIRLIRSLVGEGVGALVVTHDPAQLLGVTDRVYVMADGRTGWEGSAGDLRLDAGLADTMGIRLATEDIVAAGLEAKGMLLATSGPWTAEELADAIVEARP